MRQNQYTRDQNSNVFGIPNFYSVHDITMYLAVTDTFIILTAQKSIHSSAFIVLSEVTPIEKVPLSN